MGASPTIHLLCGLTGSGKTTFAARLARQRCALPFNSDEWMIRFFGHHMTRQEFDERLQSIQSVQLDVALRLLELGVESVLDWGFWNRAHRDSVREQIARAGGCTRLYFLDVPLHVLRSRLIERNGSRCQATTFEITEDMLNMFAQWFQPPGPDECPVILSDLSGTISEQ